MKCILKLEIVSELVILFFTKQKQAFLLSECLEHFKPVNTNEVEGFFILYFNMGGRDQMRPTVKC